jgi:hypothetical protein
MTDNWKENATKMVWTHKSNPHLKVMIVPNHGVKPLTKYIVVHYHPGTEGIVVPQPFEHTSSVCQEVGKSTFETLERPEEMAIRS